MNSSEANEFVDPSIDPSSLLGCGSLEGATCLDDTEWLTAPQCVAWRVDTESESTCTTGALTEIPVVSVEQEDEAVYIRMETEGVPAYSYALGRMDIAELVGRPTMIWAIGRVSRVSFPTMD